MVGLLLEANVSSIDTVLETKTIVDITTQLLSLEAALTPLRQLRDYILHVSPIYSCSRSTRRRHIDINVMLKKKEKGAKEVKV